MNPSLLVFFVLIMSFSYSTTKYTEASSHIYLTQKAPDNTPQIFGKDVVSVKGRFDMGFTISPDGKSMAFGVSHDTNPEETCIYLMRYLNGKWTSPDKSFLPDNTNTFFPMFSPSGDEFYFAKSTDGSETDIWVAKYEYNTIMAPQPLDSFINSKSREAGHGLSKSGSFYFTSNRDDQNQCCGDIYHTQLKHGVYSQVERSNILSSEADEESLFLSPDEDYIIIQAWRGEYESKHDLYISYRTKKGTWSAPQRLNSMINGKEIEQRPFVSADNKYLFFSRMSITLENDQDKYDSDIYWVSTRSVFSPYLYNDQINTSLKFGEKFECQIPKDLFKDVDDEQLTYKLSLEDDSDIPEWMSFEPDRLRLSGKWSTKKTLHLKLKAMDTFGNSGEFIFELSEEIN